MNNSLKVIKKVIKKSKKVAIFTHIDPDFDALGSSIALKCSLRLIGKMADVYIKDKLTFNQELIYKDEEIFNTKCQFNEYDLLISVDTPSISRLGDYGEGFSLHDNTIVVDHHENRGLIGKYNLVNTNSSSCAELVLKIIKSCKLGMNTNIASYIFSAISADTGSFQHTNVNSDTFLNAYELIKLGANTTFINERQYKSVSKKEVEFNKYFWNNIQIIKSCAFCLFSIDTLKQLKGSKADCEGFSARLNTLNKINYSFTIVEEKKGIYKVSLRSKAEFNVRLIAEKLGGGGHDCAAGATINAGDIQEAKNKVLSLTLK